MIDGGVSIIKNFAKILIGFIILDLYFNLVTVKLGNPIIQFGSIVLFFPLAHWVAVWTKLDGLKGLGMDFHYGWKKNFFISFLTGFGFWMVMYGLQFYNGELKFIGVKDPTEIIMPTVEIFIGYLAGSLINDLIVRGYVINQLKDRIHIIWVFTISIIIYALDDYWYAGFSLSNIIFSIILGLSLTLAFYKTGSIWADTGLHYGLNIAYGLFYGLVGNPQNGIFIIEETGHESGILSLIQYIIPALMFLFVIWILKYYKRNPIISTIGVGK